MKIDKLHFVPGKLGYARGERPAVPCILCAVAADDPRVDRLVVYRNGPQFVTLNLFPYNPGHLMVVPERHVEHLQDLTEQEALEIHRLQMLTLRVLDSEYRPTGYNIGYNIGKASGASIDHIHLQIVPRYPTEIGFFDLLSDSRVIVEDPRVTQERLKAAFARLGRA
jgi:ATP adenylyltransferase